MQIILELFLYIGCCYLFQHVLKEESKSISCYGDSLSCDCLSCWQVCGWRFCILFYSSIRVFNCCLVAFFGPLFHLCNFQMLYIMIFWEILSNSCCICFNNFQRLEIMLLLCTESPPVLSPTIESHKKCKFLMESVNIKGNLFPPSSPNIFYSFKYHESN